MMTLDQLSAALVRHHVATAATPLPPMQPGITWIWAANGIWKRGVSADLDALICVQPIATQASGLANLLPVVRWQRQPTQLPGVLLRALLLHAQRAATGPMVGRALRPIEQQYHIVLDATERLLRVIVPPQNAGPGHVRYTMPDSPILVDLHSHHEMAAYFSATDDRDDTGLSVSAVIGRIYTNPEIAVRLNVYGHRCRVPATVVFADLGPFRDTYEGNDAST